MLPLSTKRLKLYISREKLILVLQQGLFTKEVLNTHVVNIEREKISDNEVISHLRTMLAKNNYRYMAVDIILSADYVKYMVMPCNYQLTVEEQNILAKHSFETIFGESVDDWSIFFSITGFNSNEFACATETAFLIELSKVIQGQNLKLLSVAPSLTAAINYFRKKLPVKSWFVMIEQENMQLVKFINGSPVMLRTVRMPIGWENELETMLARESLYLEENKLPVFFFWPDNPDFVSELFKKNKVNILRMKTIYGFSASRDSAWAVGLCA